MKKIENFQGKAPKIKDGGHIQYHLWIDDSGALYVQMFENDIDTPTPGTFDALLFPVSQYMNSRCSEGKMSVSQGYNISTCAFQNINNNNTSAFLKAVLRHLLPCS
ncbi:hypothetical protein RYR53_000317 [Aeromonas hydrophila]|nr:hypothetical protein [Aeromonas hydrophila]